MSSALPSADTCTKKWLAPGQHALAASHAPHSRLTSPVSSTHGAVAHHGSHESMCVATQLVKNTLILALPGFPGPAVQLCELSCRLWVTFKSPPLHHNTQHNIEHITAISAALARVCTLTRHSAQRATYGFMPRTPAHAHNTQNRICLRAYRGAHANEDAADEGKEDGGAQHGIVARAADLAEDEDCTTHTAACKRG